MLSENGLVEVLSYPFISESELDQMRIPQDDGRRVASQLLNPLSAEQPYMRTTILAPLLSTARRNVGRGFTNVAIYELGLIVLPAEGFKAKILSVASRPSDDDLAQLNDAVPVQPWYVGAVLCGDREVGDPLTATKEKWDWQKTISLACDIVNLNFVQPTVLQTEQAPWHPGRCAAIVMGNNIVGFAGELHPRVVEAYGLPARSCAFEIDVEAVSYLNQEVTTASRVKTFPPAKIDLAFVVDQKMPVSVLKRAIEAAGIVELDSLDLFDVYTGEQVPSGSKSVAFSLTFRAIDRTFTDAEIADLRLRAIAATEPLGATLR